MISGDPFQLTLYQCKSWSVARKQPAITSSSSQGRYAIHQAVQPRQLLWKSQKTSSLSNKMHIPLLKPEGEEKD